MDYSVQSERLCFTWFSSSSRGDYSTTRFVASTRFFKFDENQLDAYFSYVIFLLFLNSAINSKLVASILISSNLKKINR